MNNDDKPTVLPVARDPGRSGFRIVATRGTARTCGRMAWASRWSKVNEGRPNVADQMVNGQVDLIVNTPLGRESFFDDRTTTRRACRLDESTGIHDENEQQLRAHAYEH